MWNSIVSGTDQFLLQESDPLLSQKLKHPVFMLPNVEFMQLQDLCALSPLTPPTPIKILGQSEPAPTSAPTGMDGALIGFSFLSLCHPQVGIFPLPFLSPDSFFCNFIFSLPPTRFLFFFHFWNFSHPPTRPSTNLPTNTLNRYLPNPTYMATPTT